MSGTQRQLGPWGHLGDLSSQRVNGEEPSLSLPLPPSAPRLQRRDGAAPLSWEASLLTAYQEKKQERSEGAALPPHEVHSLQLIGFPLSLPVSFLNTLVSTF